MEPTFAAPGERSRKRLLMRVLGDRLGPRWSLGYDLTASLPDHSTTPV